MTVPITEITISTRHVHIAAKAAGVALLMMMIMMLLKKDYNGGVTKSNPTQKYRPAKCISKGVNIQIIKVKDITEQPNNK
jgi:hypothetical protein